MKIDLPRPTLWYCRPGCSGSSIWTLSGNVRKFPIAFRKTAKKHEKRPKLLNSFDIIVGKDYPHNVHDVENEENDLKGKEGSLKVFRFLHVDTTESKFVRGDPYSGFTR